MRPIDFLALAFVTVPFAAACSSGAATGDATDAGHDAVTDHAIVDQTDGHAEAGSCDDDSVCPSGQICGGARPHQCGACSGNAACQADSLFGSMSECLVGRCVVDKACLGDSDCPTLTISGDPPSSSGLRGYADPTVRRSLDGSTIYMAYSYPTSVTSPAGSTLAIQTHLAQSKDSGATWSFVRALFAYPDAVAVPGGGGTQAAASSEEISLLSAALDPTHPDTEYWVSAREKYYASLAGETTLKPSTYALRIGMVQASSPAGLGDAEASEQVLTEANDSASFVTAVAPSAQVRSLGDILASAGAAPCELAWSPALIYEAPNLYLAIECTNAAASASSILVLKTAPHDGGKVLPVASWSWAYVGSFGGESDAALMRSDANMTIQPDLAWASDKTLLFVATPAAASGTMVSGRLGCDVMEMASLDPPALKKANGQLVFRDLVTTPDLAPGSTFGEQAGSCGYEPAASAGGLIQARKTTSGKVISSTLDNTQIHD
jgi:hypothetical protein